MVLIAVVVIVAGLLGGNHEPMQLAIWPWVIPLLKTLGTAAVAGAASGVTSRVERAVGGSQALPFGATGSGFYGQYATQQAASQGQSEAFSERSQSRGRDTAGDLQYNTLQHGARESMLQRTHEMNMLQMELSAEGQSTGEIPFWKHRPPPGDERPLDWALRRIIRPESE